jgi:hypothetical protein
MMPLGNVFWFLLVTNNITSAGGDPCHIPIPLALSVMEG